MVGNYFIKETVAADYQAAEYQSNTNRGFAVIADNPAVICRTKIDTQDSPACSWNGSRDDDSNNFTAIFFSKSCASLDTYLFVFRP